MEIDIPVNRMQMLCKVMAPKNLVLVCGRATGKSWILGQRLDEAFRLMPRCVVGMPVKTFGMGYTGTFQTMLGAMEKFGYLRDGNYVVGRRPPEGWADPYNKVEKNENTISVSNGCKVVMFSQTEKDTMRGANVDKIVADEALTLSEEKLMKEAMPTNRGNLEHFSKGAHHACHLHHGFDLTTSMPYTREQRWILRFADYYREIHDCDILGIWNKVTTIQLQLLDTDNPKQFAECWNEAERVRSLMPPRLSPDGTLFYLSNAFDNIRNVGLKYLLDMKAHLTRLELLTEVMNVHIEKVDDCYYAMREDRQIYYTGYDTARVLDGDGKPSRAVLQAGKTFSGNSSENGNAEIRNAVFNSSAFDRDCDPERPLEIAPDWGSRISLFVVCQTFPKERAVVSESPLYEPEPSFSGEYLYQINEFFAKPDGGSNALIEEICGRFCAHYAAHRNRTVILYRDRYGDHRNPNVFNSRSYNEQAVEFLRNHGWNVITRTHRGMEPPQSDKYLLWADILAEKDSCPVRFRINGNRCRYTLISMNNTRMLYGGDRFKKDKSSERPGSGVLPEEATHFSDAIDKLVWCKYGDSAGKRKKMFVPANI